MGQRVHRRPRPTRLTIHIGQSKRSTADHTPNNPITRRSEQVDNHGRRTPGAPGRTQDHELLHAQKMAATNPIGGSRLRATT